MADTWEGLEPTGYCYNCGTYLKSQRIYTMNYQPRLFYCNRRCLSAKPPKLVKIEKEYGKPAREAILDKLNKTGSVEIAAGFFNMDPSELRKYMKRLDIKKRVIFE